MTEFDLIKNYFMDQGTLRQDVLIGIGDDAAIVTVPQNHELAITTDTLVADVHFLSSAKPFDVGYKSLAVNLSDLAAMGATPAWVTLAITLSNAHEEWIQEFCQGFFTLANRYQVQLIGGDMTRGPLSITVQAMGFVAKNSALRRSGANSSDLIYVTGTLGDAGLGLQLLRQQTPLNHGDQDYNFMLERLNRPQPRVDVGHHLIGLASAAIDISDGLAADLGHILAASHVGALVNVDQLPLSDAMRHTLANEKAIDLALTSGDDYELCFTIPVTKQKDLEKQLSSLPCRYTCIGVITEQIGLDLHYQDGSNYDGSIQGFQHF